MKRRKFIGMLAGGACLAASSATAGGTHHFTGYPDSFGVLFDSTKCIGCRKCVDACIVGAVHFHEERKIPIICKHCGACTRFCPHGCLRMEEQGDVL